MMPTANLETVWFVANPFLRTIWLTSGLELIEGTNRGHTSSCFIATHQSEIEETCDRVLILRQGRLVHDQSITDLKRQHRIRARLVGDLPEVPAELRSKLSIIQQDGQLQIETPAQLSLVMSWLSGAPLDDVYIQPVSLRAVYDRFHSEWVEDEK